MEGSTVSAPAEKALKAPNEDVIAETGALRQVESASQETEE